MCFLAVRPVILEFWSVQFGVDLWKNEWVPQAFWTRTRISFLSILDLRSWDFPNIANVPGLQESSILISIVVAIRLNLYLRALCTGVSNCCGQGPAMPLDGLWLEALQYYLSNPGKKTNAQKYSKTLEPVQELLLLESRTGESGFMKVTTVCVKESHPSKDSHWKFPFAEHTRQSNLFLILLAPGFVQCGCNCFGTAPGGTD